MLFLKPSAKTPGLEEVPAALPGNLILSWLGSGLVPFFFSLYEKRTVLARPLCWGRW